MTSPSSNKHKDLLDRLVILEKFIELKSNECAYYRTKVHLMQMSTKRSSSEDISQNSIDIHRLKKGRSNSSIRQYRTSAKNQNYYENNQRLDKNIQCNENDFHLIESPPTILKLRLPHRFVKSLLAQKKKTSTPKLKVHLSSALLNKLFQSIHSNQNPFTIQSQFGKIAACINHENSSKAIHVKAEVKTDRLPIIRHIAHTRSDDSNRRKTHHTRRTKKYFYKSSSSSRDDASKRSSLTNITQTSFEPMNNSIQFENVKNKRHKINIKR